MAKSLTIELPDEEYSHVTEMALKAGKTPEEWARQRLKAVTPAAAHPADHLTPDERAAARAEILRIAGTADLGYATGVDNEQIDRDLADEYASTHEEQP